MRRRSKKKKITYIVTSALFLLLALFMLFLLSREPSLRRDKNAAPTPAPTLPVSTAAPNKTVIVAGKAVDPETDSFDLSGRTLSEEELSQIASLQNLTTLSLTGCGVSDLRFLSGLTELRTLYLPDNEIRDLTALMGLNRLKTIYLDRNPITDMTPLTLLPELSMLSLQGVPIAGYVLEDLKAAMPNCRIFTDTVVEEARPISLGGTVFTEDAETLDLSWREITDISRLSYCLQLRTLDLSGNSLESLQTLAGLPKLTALTLASANLQDQDLVFLATLQRLTYLDVRNNPALTAEALDALEAALPNCQVIHDTVYYTVELGGLVLTSDASVLDLSGRGVTDLTGLEKFRMLRRLTLDRNGLTRLDALRELFSLEELHLGSNSVEDLSPLTGHIALRRLYLPYNAVSDLTALSSCAGLEELDLRHNRVADPSPLYLCAELRWVDLTGNPLITADQIRALQVALPGCQIVTDADLSMPEPTPVPPPGAGEPEPIPEFPEGMAH